MLKGRKAVVTGASRGIGRAIALQLASQGVHIAAICSHDKEKAEEVCRECEDRYQVEAAAFLCNVADERWVKRTVQAVCEAFGSIQILVNNAGITRDSLAIMMKEEDFDQVLDINLKGAFLMAKHCLPVFLKQKNGVIINISSVSGLAGNAGQSNYAASKAGLIGLTKSLAREYASRGIRCNAVAPGYIDTEMTKKLGGQLLEERIPLGRKGTPEDVAQAVTFLSDAEYITGETLRVDGGFAM